MQPPSPDPITTRRTSTEAWGNMVWLADDRDRVRPGLSLARMTVHAGRTSPGHSHPDCTEVIHVLEGSLRQRIDDREYRVDAGETIVIPVGAVHSSTNAGNGDLVVMVAYSTGTRTYRPETA